MSRPITSRRSVTFRIIDDALYVANFGRRFDRRGVVSVCRENLSAKTNRGPGSSLDEVSDRGLIDAIRERRLAVYRTDIDQLQEDANHERETSSDYAGRSLWELLQNADDALAPVGTSSADLIGAKGLGFKSVLEVTDRPSIHSGPFDFGFDASASRQVLRAIDPDAPDLTFRLPHTVARDGVTKELIKEGFTTVVRLPFRSAAVRAGVTARLNALAPHFLLLCRNLDTVVIEGAGPTLTTFTVSRPRSLALRNASAKLTVTRNDETSESQWRLWSSTAAASRDDGKTLSVAIAIATMDDIAVPAEDEIPIHVFFPTAELISARFLVHGSFALTSNRNNIKLAEHDEDVRQALQSIVAQVVEDIAPASVVRVFGDVVRATKTSRVRRPDRLIQQAISSAVSNAAFVRLIGGGRAPPRDVRTWDHELDELVLRNPGSTMRLPTRELAPVFADLRTTFGAEPLRAHDYAALLAASRIDNLPKALRAIRIAHAGGLSANTPTQIIDLLATAPIWPTEDGGIRSLVAQPPLLRRRPAGWPSWLAGDLLHPAAMELLESYDAAGVARWLPLLSGRLLKAPDEWLAQALAPALASWSDERWGEAGYEALLLVEDWATIADFTEVPPLVEMPDDRSMRLALASVARIPTRNGWVASRSAYAGREIGGSNELAGFFRNVPGRAIANAPVKALSAFGIKRWKALLRFLGVSWEPKIHFVGRDGSLTEQPSWQLFHVSSGSNVFHVNQEWFIEHFPQCLEQLTAPQVAACVSSLATATSHLEGRWRKVVWADRTHRPEPFMSFADFQLKRERYLPQKPVAGMSSGRLAPHELFWPGKGIVGITPIIDVGTINQIRKSGLKPTFVRRLKVHDALPQDWQTWIEWSQSLLARIESGQKVQTKSVRDFYDAMLRIPDRAKGTATLPQVAATFPDRAGDVIVARSSDVLWIDSGRFENQEVLNGLGQKGIAILPVRLDRGRGAPEVLGVRPASQVLAVEPYYQHAIEKRSAEIRRRLNARRGALAAICRTKGLFLKAVPDFVAVNDLRLRVSLEGEPLADRTASSFKEDGRYLINLQSGEKWEAVAAATAEQFGLHGADLKYRFARILRASRDEVAAILADDGIPQYRIREALHDLDGEEEPEEPTTGQDSGVDDADGAQGNDVESDSSLDDDDRVDDKAEANTDEEREQSSNDDDGQGQSKPNRVGPRRLKPRKLFGGGGGDERKHKRRDAAEAAEAAANRGLRAEAWLMRQVAACIGSGWTCSANVRDDYLRETDLLLAKGAVEFHIEVKSLASERIYWSELEREKAEQYPGRYFMALLVEDEDESYRVRWLWDPLTDLAGLPRRIEWLWRGVEEGPSVSEGWRLESGARWPQRTADRFIHVVHVTQDHLDTLDADGDGLPRLRERIAQPQTGSGAPGTA